MTVSAQPHGNPASSLPESVWVYLKQNWPRWLLIGVLFALGVGVAWLFAYSYGLIHAGDTTRLLGMNFLSLEAITITGFFVGLILILVSMPAILVITYQVVKADERRAQVELDLQMCGLDASSAIVAKMNAYRLRNSLVAYFWPTALATLLLVFFWGIVILPTGFLGGMLAFQSGGTFVAGREIIAKFDAAQTLQDILNHSSPVTWAFLGAYFYIVSTLIQRWTQSDLTAGFLWRVNLRLVVALLLGLLLIQAGSLAVLAQDQDVIWLIAFLGGITPDIVIGWLVARVKAVLNVTGEASLGEWAAGTFQSSELQQKIDGLSFWQAERLREEGIESVRNLAVKDIPDLIVRTRFDTARLIDWVDQALLCAETGGLVTIESLRAIGVHAAADLLKIWAGGELGQRQLVTAWLMAVQEQMVHQGESLSAESLALANDPHWHKAAVCLLGNVVTAVQVGANMRYVLTFWRNTNTSGAASVTP